MNSRVGREADLRVQGHLDIAKLGLEHNSLITQTACCQCWTAQGCKYDPMLDVQHYTDEALQFADVQGILGHIHDVGQSSMPCNTVSASKKGLCCRAIE